jgi:hypothetical protein
MGGTADGQWTRVGNAARCKHKTKVDAMNMMVVTSLAKTIQPLKEYFNHNKDQYRFLAVLSPT